MKTDVNGKDPVLSRRAGTIISIFFAVCTFQIFTYMYFSAPTPYMDEEFHIPQAQKYCNGTFSEWDPKLTTLPGLYFISLLIWKPLAAFTAVGAEPCSVWNLRLTNFFLAVLSVSVFQKILKKIHPGHVDARLLLTAINFATFPLLYFFAFLYYTDQASTFFVFATLYFHLNKQRKTAAVFAAMSVIIRQTNIVLVGALALLEVFRSYKIIMMSVLKKDDIKNISTDVDLQVLLAPFVSLRQVPTVANFKRIAGYFLGVILESLPNIVIYGIVLFGFVVFLVINNGIVVGDRSAHQPVFHAPQLFYFALFTLFFASPILCTPQKFRKFLADCCSNPFVMFVLAALIFVSIHRFTYVHKYLISDNRHYTFYIWKRIFERNHNIKYAFTPIYLYGLWAIWDELRDYRFFRPALYIAAVAATVMPQKLVEFRYFILPFLLFRVQLRNVHWAQLLIEFLLYQSVNAATIYLFVAKPFIWSNSKQLQHFMW